MVKENTKAADFSLPNVNNSVITLSELISKDQHVLLVFLRHLG